MNITFSGFDTHLSFNVQNQYKYLLDIDGNSWSGRFRRLMLSNGAVMKATIFQEFWTDWAIPWLHFIPVQIDYSDLWDILAFFRGGPDGEGGHDALAREIGQAGKEWAKLHMRWEDIEAYTFRQMLEYGRLYNGDKEGERDPFLSFTFRSGRASELLLTLIRTHSADMDFRLEVDAYEPIWYDQYV